MDAPQSGVSVTQNGKSRLPTWDIEPNCRSRCIVTCGGPSADGRGFDDWRPRIGGCDNSNTGRGLVARFSAQLASISLPASTYAPRATSGIAPALRTEGMSHSHGLLKVCSFWRAFVRRFVRFFRFRRSLRTIWRGCRNAAMPATQALLRCNIDFFDAIIHIQLV